MITPDWIRKNLLNKTNGLNNWVLKKEWWDNRNFQIYYDSLFKGLDFLDETASIPERLYCIFKNIQNIPKCYNCDTKVNFNSFKDGYRIYCTSLCQTKCPDRNAKIQSKLDRVEIFKKIKETSLQKYGENSFLQTEAFKKLAKKKKLEKYGDEFYNNFKKSKETNLERYGVEYTCISEEIKKKIQDNRINKYPNLRDKKWLNEQNKTKGVQQISEELGATYRTVYLSFKRLGLSQKFFRFYGEEQKEISDFIESLDIEVVINDRIVIKPKEIDIYVPEFRLGVEYNGMYWHSEDKKKHKEKLDICNSSNIKLLQIWDVEWKSKKEIVKSILRSKLNKTTKIFARKCRVDKIDSLVYNNFLEDNHIQGQVNSSIRYGLFFNDILVSVIGFGKSRYDKKYSHELLRFCNIINHTVVGGFSKLLKHSIKNNEMLSIQTFCDLRLFNGEMYEKCGFSFSHISSPGYVYYKQGVIKNRLEFQKHKLKDIFENFDNNLTERENANLNGWLQVWDCGQGVYKM